MDSLPATWSSQSELDDPAFIHYDWEMMLSIIPQPTDYLSFSNPEINPSGGALQNLGNISKPPSPLTFCTSPQETLMKTHFASPPFSAQFISFENSNSCDSGAFQPERASSFAVTTEEEMKKMLSFGNMDYYSSSPSSPSYSDSIGLYGQYVRSGASRTPSQAKFHVIAERKRRRNLSQRFISLSTLVPGLKKFDKASILDGAINRLRQLEKQLKTVEEGKNMRDEEFIHAEQMPSCLSYGYYEEEDGENFSPSFDNFESVVDQPSRKLEIRIREGVVLIRIVFKNRKRFMEEGFIMEMKKLDLKVTKIKLLPFGDNRLAVSAEVTQMKEEFSMADEDLANSIRLAILKFI